MEKSQWILIATFAASSYNVGTIWMTQFGWSLWPYVAPDDFRAYHAAWWAMIKPVIFPVAGIAFFGAIAMIRWRPVGVPSAAIWLNVLLQVLTYALTAIFWGRWQAHTHYARLPNGSLDPMYVRGMSTHWMRGAIITLNGFVVLWMVVRHLTTIRELY